MTKDAWLQMYIPPNIALFGGNEFQSSCMEFDRSLIKACANPKPKIAIIPTAASFENPKKAANNGLKYFASLGANPFDLMILNREDANDQSLGKKLEDTDVIYLTGGDPSHLYEVLQGSVFLNQMRVLYEKGAIIAGSSAGAMVLGEFFGVTNPKKGLGVVPATLIVPHCEKFDIRSLRQPHLVNEKGIQVIGLDTATGVLNTGDDLIMKGKGEVTVFDMWSLFLS